MRMWMCDPTIMCTKHLLVEHNELHMLVSMIKQKSKLTEFIKKDWVEPKSICERHDVIIQEMLNRNITHSTPILNDFDITYLGKDLINWKINRSLAKRQLINKCSECNK